MALGYFHIVQGWPSSQSTGTQHEHAQSQTRAPSPRPTWNGSAGLQAWLCRTPARRALRGDLMSP